MRKILLIFFIINFNNFSFGSIKENIINNLQNTNNISFDFEQNINGKIEKGNCIIEYPKKIFCKYYKSNNKIHSIGLSNQMTMDDVRELAFDEIEKLNQEK